MANRPPYKSTTPLAPASDQQFISPPSSNMEPAVPGTGSQASANGASGRENMPPKLAGYSNDGAKGPDNYTHPVKKGGPLFPR